MEKRVIVQTERKGFQTAELLLIGVLLAAGAVLKFFVGTMVNIGGMKPNFIIAMYCLIILLIRPKLYQSVIIGILAGVICQFFPGTPYINLISELVGGLTMGILIYLPMKIKRVSLQPIIATFLSTLASGFTFLFVLYIALYAGVDVKAMPMDAFIVIILGTATLNAIIVQLLYLPLKRVLGGAK